MRVALAATWVIVTAVIATSPAMAAPRPDLATVTKQVTALREQMATASERYDASQEKLKTVTLLAKAATGRVQQQQRAVDTARRMLGKIAVDTYKAGDLHALSMFLSDDPQGVLAASGLWTTLSNRQARAVQALVDAQARLTADRAALATQSTNLAAESTRLAGARKDIEGRLATYTRLMASLTTQQRRAIARAGSTMDRDALAQLGVTVPASGVLSCSDVKIESPSARVSKVIAFACAQLGERYTWGGDGPSSWDCSGLTMAAWATAGVSLPHNAQMQSGYGRHVPVSALQPGDLIYFNGYDHMGLYIGKGLMIHAPHTGDVVRIASARLGQIIDATRL